MGVGSVILHSLSTHWGERVDAAQRRMGEVGMRRCFPHLIPTFSAPGGGEGDSCRLAAGEGT
jgi:hypothetical protein